MCFEHHKKAAFFHGFMKPFFLATALKWYKRRNVQEAIIENCEHREFSPRYGQGFGKRPDVVYYPADILSFATRKATSFHCSEERWRDPLQIQTGSSRKVLDELRTGWDLVLDIDCPHWLFAKLTAALFVKALRDNGVESISVKFSGNKGFHIGVPFEAFPEEVDGQPTESLFPEAPRAIAQYLLKHIEEQLITVKDNIISFDIGKTYTISFSKLKEITDSENEDLIKQVDAQGNVKQEVHEGVSYLCQSCGNTRKQESFQEYLQCERCNGVMEPQERQEHVTYYPRFNVRAIVEVDTVLLASRHLFRAPYSLHEKSGLVSIVFNPDAIMSFQKEMAKPENVKEFKKFLLGGKPSEGARLLSAALQDVQQPEEVREYVVPEEAIPEELFPPCMRNILNGMTDGRKRAMFALTNFLRSCGWGKEQIEVRLQEWNKQNEEPLREVAVKGHLRHALSRKEVFPPPSCKSFYQDLRVCTPDAFCARIKNPASYAKLKATLQQPKKKTARAKLTEEQKAMRRAHRERQKSDETSQ